MISIMAVYNESEKVAVSVPLMTREAFAQATGLELTVLMAQCNRGYWPTVKVGKRVLINVEAVRLMAAQKHVEFVGA